MRKKYRSNHRTAPSSPIFAFVYKNSAFFVFILFFFAVCLCFEDSIKQMTMVLIALVLVCGVLRFSTFRERLTIPLAVLFFITLMDGISICYAVSTKFALYEFLQVLAAFCLSLLLVMLAKGSGVQPGRWIASVLEGNASLVGLISIDLISTRWISEPVLEFLKRFTKGYSNLTALIPGTRITSIFSNPNVFASIVGLGVLLSLGLSLSAVRRRERCFHLTCLFINALSFVLAFSMGASAMIAAAFLVYLILERKERRGALFLLMLETLVLTICAAMLVSMTSFQTWSEPQLVPLLSIASGAAGLCLLDCFVGQRLAEKIQDGKVVLFLIGGVFALVLGYAFAALSWTEGVTVLENEPLLRAAYPPPGEYVLHVEADEGAMVSVYSRNQQEVILETSTPLYSGSLAEASFSVPGDSQVVYFSFHSEQPVHISSVAYTGAEGSGTIPLKYKLLPGFIANRLQGVLSSTSGTLRLVLFSDGLRLFRRSPVFGLGMGAFESDLKSVQSFYFVTQYAHNHYIQSLVDTGIVGLTLFVGLIGVSAVAVLLSRRKEDSHPLVPALGAALVFMAGHASVELIFSIYSYLPMAFGVFALIGLCCGDSLPQLSQKMKFGLVAAIAVPLCIFAVLLSENMQAANGFRRNPTFLGLEMAAARDKFEWADYMLSYVTNSMDDTLGVDDDIRQKADLYAERLSELDSNIVPLRLAEYYLYTGRLELGLEMAEKYVRYVPSDQQTWQQTFDLLERYERSYTLEGKAFRDGVIRIAEIMETWNAENIGEVSVDDGTKAFLARMRGEEIENME